MTDEIEALRERLRAAEVERDNARSRIYEHRMAQIRAEDELARPPRPRSQNWATQIDIDDLDHARRAAVQQRDEARLQAHDRESEAVRLRDEVADLRRKLRIATRALAWFADERSPAELDEEGEGRALDALASAGVVPAKPTRATTDEWSAWGEAVRAALDALQKEEP